MKKSKVIATAVVVMALAGSTAACGAKDEAGGSSDLSPVAAVKAAAESSEKITSLGYRLKGSYPGTGKVEGTAKMNLKPMALSMKFTGEGADQSGEIILVDEAMYIGGGAPSPEMDGKKYMKFDMKGLEKEAGAGAPAVPGQATQNPAAEAAFLSAADDVKKIGSETIDGEKTTHYRGTVGMDEMRKSFEDEKAEVREQREKSLKQYEELGVKEFTMDLWIGEENRTKQFRMQGDAQKGKLDATVTFENVNEPVTVKAPPAGEVMDLAELAKEMEGMEDMEGLEELETAP
ncbi:DUF1396 domain-containing protein [Streptomyces sp. JNUCC 64]